WDIVRYAQHRNFFYIGRGSGANSMVAYLLHITDVDPVDLDLYFERFINAYRTSPPDFDIDFSWNDRDEVIEYIFKRNLTERTSLLATYSTFQSNSVVRELGKVFGLPKAEIDALQDPHLFPVAKDHITKLIYQYARCIHDFPNHLSIHAGGILISEKPMAYYTASSNPPKGFPLTQFSMLEAEDVGLYKFDILSQRGLGKMKDAVNIIKENRPEAIFDIHDVKRFKQDEKVREHLQQAKLMGCFYVESPAMRMLLTKLKASNYLDLVAASSIIRPGVAQSGMMQEYIRRFHDHSNLKFVHPLMEELMKETFGVMVYQEDVIKVAHHFAGLTLAESDMLRRGMGGKYRGREEFQKVEKKFFSNCKEKGYEDAVTKEVWRQIESFAGYAFSKGHSASYAVESYQCMFLKVHYPLEFMVAVINNGGGFFRVEYYVHEAMMCGGIIHAPDVNKSDVETTIDVKNIYLGFNLIAESEKKLQQEIAEERKRNGEFASLENFMKRVSVSVDQLRILIRINAFRFTKRTKQQLLWDIHSILGHQKKSVARRELFEGENKKYLLPELFNDPFQDAKDEIEILGFPLCSPFELASPPPQGGIPRAQSWRELVSNVREHPLPFGERWRGAVEIVGYYVTYKPTRTKKGDFMMFGCFIDRDGFFFDTNHFPEAAKKFPFRGKGCYLVKGKVAEEFGFYSINVTEMHKINYVMYEEDAETLARSKPDPEIIPPVIKTSKQFQYQIAIVPPPHVCNEVMALKKKFHEQFNHYQAITLKPFITLCNFTLVELNEADLIKKIASICHQQFPFKIKLKNFKHNRRNSIFISIEKPDHLIDLVTLLNKELQLSSKESFFNYSPQLTIARDLEPEKLSKAIPLFQALEYENAFKTNSIVILRREIKTVKYELVKEFLLEGKLKPGVVR
ncbi:MAG: 2'-5' RNA ligase family protein, partial [Chitinophagales bacterium]|nr:2'-5' RNA ligase family protein [Chitinophagales bacterium]